MEFPGTVRAGLQVEMSILKRQVQNRRDAVQNTQCPHCHRNNADETGNDWYKWWLVIFPHNSKLIHWTLTSANPICGRKYRRQVDDVGVEEILSPQIAYVPPP
jgi:hypothetical protein